jgi:hypothetical protein
MGRYKLHLIGGAPACILEVDALSTRELGEDLVRRRFIVGILVEEGGQTVDPPVEVLAPLHQIRLVAAT